MPVTNDKEPIEGKNVLFLDGECVFCQKSARLIHQLDKYGRIHYAPLQGETAQQLPEEWRQLTDKLGRASGAAVLAENFGTTNAQYWRGADAPLRSLKIIGGLWKAFWLLSYIPRRIKGWFYQLIARNRYRLCAENNTCELPSDLFKKKMLP